MRTHTTNRTVPTFNRSCFCSTVHINYIWKINKQHIRLFLHFRRNVQIKWKTKKFHTVWTATTFKRCQIDTPTTHIHDGSLCWLGTGTAITSGGVKLVLLCHIAPLSSSFYRCVILVFSFIKLNTILLSKDSFIFFNWLSLNEYAMKSKPYKLSEQ